MKKVFSLRLKVLLTFLCVVVFSIMVFFLMNILLTGKTVVRQSEKDMRAVHATLSEMVADSNTTRQDFIEYLSSLKSDMNVSFALQGDVDWGFTVFTDQTVSPQEKEFLVERLQTDLLNDTSEDENVRIIEKTEDYTLQRVTLNESVYLECFGYMTSYDGAEKKFILSMPLTFVQATTTSFRPYLFLFSLISILIGSAIILVVTNRITKPIVQLSDISKRMSQLDFSAYYEGNDRTEIGVLGNNMNEMSAQIQRTILQLQISNERLQKEIEEKNHVDDMRRDFISNVSHELKTPIALIQGYAEGLSDFIDDPEQMSYYCEVIRDEAEKMNRMVKKLTTLNQLEFGEEGLEEIPFDIMEMIRGLVDHSGKLREAHHAEVTVDGPESLKVLGDQFKIEEVLNNYYSNALNHLEDPYRIRFFTDDLGVKVRVSIFNTGLRIPEEDLDRIWIKFYKVDKARTRAYGGSGIGLSIVKAIMDAHGEECGVYNTEGGVVFWFELKSAAPVPVAAEQVPDRDTLDAMKLGLVDGEILSSVGGREETRRKR